MKWLWLGVAAAAGLAAGCGAASSGGNTAPPADAVKVNVEASNWKWTIDKTTFKVGQPIDFRVRATEGAHGFSIAGTNINQTVAQGQDPVDVVWKPDKPGTYTIQCDVYCGTGHGSMQTQITVTP
ncbi:cupredoxin domain-containing protein [Alicyclobacillus macrosporangiidus]|uniref:Cytochrome c oxidase subunit 2 n=1 Tax=Alicyclobacillus macrosporangiidus TaxID=392015 RepID=A0A1I7FK77_9BACL|nr:cupredoxin domain-containing protein [Alicyclobacillus macrosporangiidus]SFU36538.1 cytochrome c oxidase subunit 2 [Alicyclobacillus macrosporangiidus]